MSCAGFTPIIVHLGRITAAEQPTIGGSKGSGVRDDVQESAKMRGRARARAREREKEREMARASAETMARARERERERGREITTNL